MAFDELSAFVCVLVKLNKTKAKKVLIYFLLSFATYLLILFSHKYKKVKKR